MIRIRFHGRGGHGVKTASRLVGTAAFLAGFQAQDSPIYGAERRGAAVTAATRIDESPILERGVIEHPDLIVVGDETLLEDPAAAVLAGQESATAVFVNTEAEGEGGLAEKHRIRGEVLTFDVTQRTLDVLGKASALSAGLGAAAVRLTGVVSAEELEEAIRDELAELPLGEEALEKNLRVAREVFAALPALEFRPEFPRTESSWRDETHAVGYDDPIHGTPSILSPGNAELRHTGSWRVERPEIDYEHCTRCGLCFVRCPDGAIALDEKGYPIIDYDNCKGCMICLAQCPLHAVWRRKEVHAW